MISRLLCCKHLVLSDQELISLQQHDAEERPHITAWQICLLIHLNHKLFIKKDGD